MKRHLLWLAIMVLLAGCSQKEGETCRINQDCDKGLVCCLTSSEATRGTCIAADLCVVESHEDAGVDAGDDTGTDAK